MLTEKQKHLAKAKKIFAHTQNPANANEAANAAAKLADLLAEYQLSMADVQAASETHAASDPIGDNNYPSKTNSDWERTIWNGSSRASYCRYYFSKKWNNDQTHNIVGAEINVLNAHMLAEYLVAATLTQTDWAAQPSILNNNKAQGKRWRDDFAHGVATELFHRLMDKLAAQKKPSSNPGNLPAVIGTEIQRVDDWVAKNITLSRGKQSRRRRDSSAVGAGKIAGQNIGLDRQTTTTHTASAQIS